ncbi:MAG: hypothetical protein ACRDNZ_00260, partial [Streptosporangiaceae bacterium]
MVDEIEILRIFRDEIPGPSTDAWARARSAIAVARSEEEPAGHQRRGPGWRRLFPLAAVAAAATAAVGLTAVLLPNPPVTSGPGAATSGQIRETAYVITRTGRALSSASESSMVGYTRTVYPSGVSLQPVVTGLHGQRGAAGSPWSVASMVSWSYRGTGKMSAFTAAGQRVFDERITLAGGRAGATLAVIYRDATWWRAAPSAAPTAPPRSPPGCGPGLTIGPGGWPAFIRQELSCGQYTAAGRQRVDGVDAIKVTGHKGLDTLWVNPANYLPVRAIFQFGQGRPRMLTDFR